MATENNKIEIKKTGSIFILQPKVKPFKVFFFKELNEKNIKELIGFTGVTPTINADLSINIKKTKILPNTFISVNMFGEVLRTYTQEEVNNLTDVVSIRDFNETDINKVVEKIRKTREPKK